MFAFYAKDANRGWVTLSFPNFVMDETKDASDVFVRRKSVACVWLVPGTYEED